MSGEVLSQEEVESLLNAMDGAWRRIDGGERCARPGWRRR